MNMNQNSCAFTGHRPKSFPWKYNEDNHANVASLLFSGTRSNIGGAMYCTSRSTGDSSCGAPCSKEKHLLPQMDEYLQNIPDTELASMTRDLLIEHGVIHSPIAQRAGDTYYFNENEVYTLDKASQLSLILFYFILQGFP